METNKATQENIQEQYVPKQQYSSHSYYTEEDRLRDELREQKDKIKKLEAEQRDDRIFKAINEFKSEVNIKFSKLDDKFSNKLEIMEAKFNEKMSSNKLWVITSIVSCTTIIGLLMTAFKFWH
ncbi:MAG: hypothetical protein OEY79_02755 [Anaplasmataceae bacterium]|nr:hypothetical protein [Anaplasmataceae bacterium]